MANNNATTYQCPSCSGVMFSANGPCPYCGQKFAQQQTQPSSGVLYQCSGCSTILTDPNEYCPNCSGVASNEQAGQAYQCPTCSEIIFSLSDPCPSCGQQFGPSQETASTDKGESVREYNMDDLRRQVDGVKVKRRTRKTTLDVIKEERVKMEQDRKKMLAEMKQREEEMKYLLESELGKREQEKNERAAPKPLNISGFAVERRKIKELDRIRKILISVEILLMVLMIAGLIYSGSEARWNEITNGGLARPATDVPFDLFLTLEPLIFLMFAMGAGMFVQGFYFSLIHVRHKATLQSKFLEVEDLTTRNISNIVIFGLLTALFALPQIKDTMQTILLDKQSEWVIVSVDFLFYVLLFWITYLAMFVSWSITLAMYKKKVLLPEQKKLKDPYAIEDVFVITTTGLLINHSTRRLKPGVDDDILTGMLTVIRDFVKDSFKSHEEGELDEIQYGRLRVLIEYGPRCYLATVISGMEPADLRKEMKRSLKTIHRRFGQTLRDWDGDLSKLVAIKDIVSDLLSKKL